MTDRLSLDAEEFADYTLRHIEKPLWDAFKARAKAEGRTYRWILIQLIEDYVRWGLR